MLQDVLWGHIGTGTRTYTREKGAAVSTLITELLREVNDTHELACAPVLFWTIFIEFLYL